LAKMVLLITRGLGPATGVSVVPGRSAQAQYALRHYRPPSVGLAKLFPVPSTE
jgi:hypothetical protein